MVSISVLANYLGLWLEIQRAKSLEPVNQDEGWQFCL